MRCIDKDKELPQDYKEAFKWFRNLPQSKGNAKAQLYVGMHFVSEKGDGVTKRLQRSNQVVDDLQQNRGIQKHYTNLGFGLCTEDKVVPQDYKEAIKWWKLAADQGDAEGQFSLGHMYDNGQGVPQDYKEAGKWYRLSAEQGNATRTIQLGSYVSKRKRSATRPIKKQSSGFVFLQNKVTADSQYELGSDVCHMGQGVPRDYVLAYMWFKLAGSNGYQDGCNRRYKEIIGKWKMSFTTNRRSTTN